MQLETVLDFVSKKKCLLRECEARWLYDVVANFGLPDGIVLEIGSYLGASTNVLAAAAQESAFQVVSIDNGTNLKNDFGLDPVDFYSNKQGIHENLRGDIEYVVGCSVDKIPEVIEKFGDISFAFIDGEHGYPDSKVEFLAMEAAMHVGSVVAFHDTDDDFPPVQKCIGELLSEGKLSGWSQITPNELLGTHVKMEIDGFCDGTDVWSITAFQRRMK